MDLGAVMSVVLEHPDDERFYIENVEPLIASVEARGKELEFVFRCPLSGFEARYSLQPGLHLNKPEVPLSFRYAEALDKSTKARAVGAEAGDISPAGDWTVSEIEEAACDAFEAVSSDFLWDGMRWTYWEAEDLVAEFLDLIDGLQTLSSADRRVLQAVLGSTVFADGSVKSSAKTLLSSLLDSELTLSRSVIPTEEAIGELGGRTFPAAAVALAYALASSDGALSKSQEDMLDVVCSRARIGALRQWELKRMAISFLVDECFTKAYELGQARSGVRGQAYALGTGLGLTKSEVRDVEWRFLKRAGLA